MYLTKRIASVLVPWSTSTWIPGREATSEMDETNGYEFGDVRKEMRRQP